MVSQDSTRCHVSQTGRLSTDAYAGREIWPRASQVLPRSIVLKGLGDYDRTSLTHRSRTAGRLMLMDNIYYRRREIILAARMRFVEQEVDSIQRKKGAGTFGKTFI